MSRTVGQSPGILIRLPNWVGDIVMALPAIQSLRAHRPEAHLIGMARPEHVELAQRIAELDEVVPAPPRTGSDRRQAWWGAVRRLRAAKLQAAVLLAPSFEAALSSWLARIPVRIGQDTDRRSWLLTEAVVVPAGQHRSDGFLDLVARLGAQPVSGYFPLVLQAPERAFADRVFAQAGLQPDARPVLVNPAAAKTPRAWSSDRFRQLAERIVDRHDGVQVLVHHHPPFTVVRDWPSHPSIYLVEGATLVELAAVVERCGLYVGNDSGPMHLAAGLGVPTVGIYGSSSPSHTSPRDVPDAPHVPVSAFLPCSPCRERFFEECPSPPTPDGRPPCLDQVTVDMVLWQVDRLLATVDSRRSSDD